MSKTSSFSLKQLSQSFGTAAESLQRYAIILYLLLLLAVYGFVMYRVSQLIGVQPTASEVNAQIQASATPHVDPAVVKQMQTLQDNNVNVQTLFDQARNNPFQE